MDNQRLLYEILNHDDVFVTRVVWTLGLIMTSGAFRSTVVWLINRNIADIRERYLWRKRTDYATLVVTVFLVGNIWAGVINEVSTFLGLVAAGLAVALREPLTNFVAWLFILIRCPFEMGDRIQIGDIAGDVIDIRILQFTVLEIGNWVAADQSTGRILHIPNGRVFNQGV